MEWGCDKKCIVYSVLDPIRLQRAVSIYNVIPEKELTRQTEQLVNEAIWRPLALAGVISKIENTGAAERDSIQELYSLIRETGATYIMTTNLNSLCDNHTWPPPLKEQQQIAYQLMRLGIRAIALPDRLYVPLSPDNPHLLVWADP